MNTIDDNSIIVEIQNEYNKIDHKWLKLHYHTFIALVLFGFLIECILGYLWWHTGQVEIPVAKYILKYTLAPLLFNLILMAIGALIMRSSHIQQKTKAYVISLMYVGGCFVFYMIHSLYYSLYLIFTVPILLTIVYSDYKLTTITALISIATKTTSELFIKWDPDKVYPLGSDLGIINFIISIFILCMFYFACIVVIYFEKEKNAASIQKEIEHYQTQQKLNTDELTQIYNRTGLRKAFQSMEDDSSDNIYTFVMMDIDNFKALNDTFGHDAGDSCLKELAQILKNNCEDNSIPFRFGGDEFCILIKNMAMADILKKCKDIQLDLKNSNISRTKMLMTASIGIASYDKLQSPHEMVKKTDSALYKSKATKDCISISDGDPK